MASPVDYRKLAHHSKGMYSTPHDCQDPDGELTRHFQELAVLAGGQPPSHRQLAVQMGRKLEVPLAGIPYSTSLLFSRFQSSNKIGSLILSCIRHQCWGVRFSCRIIPLLCHF